MALKYGSSSKSNTFKRSAFPMQSGTTSHASALKQVKQKTRSKYDQDQIDKLREEKLQLQKEADKKFIEKEADKVTTEKVDETVAADADAKAKVDASRGTHEGQVKKQGKLDKIQARQDKRAYKKYLKKNKMKGDDSTFENWKKSDDYTDKSSKREERLKKEVGMTPEEYDANQAAKKAKRGEFFEGLDQLGQTISRAYGPGGTGTMNVARSQMSIEKDAAKSQDILNRTRQLHLDEHEQKIADLQDPMEMPSDDPTAAKEDGHGTTVELGKSSKTSTAANI